MEARNSSTSPYSTAMISLLLYFLVTKNKFIFTLLNLSLFYSILFHFTPLSFPSTPFSSPSAGSKKPSHECRCNKSSFLFFTCSCSVSTQSDDGTSWDSFSSILLLLSTSYSNQNTILVALSYVALLA